MAYEPTNWKTGDIVTSEKLNKLENGVAGADGFMAVNGQYDAGDESTAETITLDITAVELYEALTNGAFVVVLVPDLPFYLGDGVKHTCSAILPIIKYSFEDKGHFGKSYYFVTMDNAIYTATSENGYPVGSHD